jgi:hypothetical protein
MNHRSCNKPPLTGKSPETVRIIPGKTLSLRAIRQSSDKYSGIILAKPRIHARHSVIILAAVIVLAVLLFGGRFFLVVN